MDIYPRDPMGAPGGSIPNPTEAMDPRLGPAPGASGAPPMPSGPPPGGPAPPPPSPSAAPPSAQGPATPEEQAHYETMVETAFMAIFGDLSDPTVRQLSGPGSAAQKVATVVVSLGKVLQQQAEAQGAKVSIRSLARAAMDVVPAVIELGVAAGVFESDPALEKEALAEVNRMWQGGAAAAPLPAGPGAASPMAPPAMA